MENSRCPERCLRKPRNKILVLMIATGPECIVYIPPAIEALKKFFPPHDVLVFTDSEEPLDAIKVYHPHTGWPQVTLRRFHATLSQRDSLLRYDHILFLDTDMLVCQPIVLEEIFGKGITAVVHPCFPDCFERRPESAACVVGDPIYYQGCLVGGSTAEFITMCEAITKGIDTDDANGIMAVWFEESHMNRYLMEHPPAISLSPAYAYPRLINLSHPETWMPADKTVDTFEPKIRHLHKAWKK